VETGEITPFEAVLKHPVAESRKEYYIMTKYSDLFDLICLIKNWFYISVYLIIVFESLMKNIGLFNSILKIFLCIIDVIYYIIN